MQIGLGPEAGAKHRMPSKAEASKAGKWSRDWDVGTPPKRKKKVM